MGADNVLVSGFYHLVVSQVSTRLITFILNLVTARLLSPEAYGLAAIQFHLINTTILFLSREGFRRGCLRMQRDPEGQSQTARILSTAALCLPLGVAVTVAVCSLALVAGGSEGAAQHSTAIMMQGLAAFIELLSEPLYILAQMQLRFRLRVIVEGGATLAKGVVTLLLLKFSLQAPALSLSFGQIVYAGVILVGYLAAYAPLATQWLLKPAPNTCAAASGSRLNSSQNADAQATAAGTAAETAPPEASGGSTGKPTLRQRRAAGISAVAAADAPPAELNSVDGQQCSLGSTGGICSAEPRVQRQPEALFDKQTLWLCGSFTLQAAEKHLLAEGSKMVMAATQTSYNQGVYGLVANLGSLVVRTLFQPIEEAAFLAFSRSEDAKGEREKGTNERAQILTVLVRCVSILGLLATAFGPSYSFVLLRVIYGERWSSTEAPAVLGVYCGYILLLAVNGVLEAFVHATVRSRELTIANLWLVVFSVVHIALSVVLVRVAGAQGLIMADAANMVMRIAYSLLFLRRYFTATPTFSLGRLFPGRHTMAALALAFAATSFSQAVIMPHTVSNSNFLIGTGVSGALTKLLPLAVRHGSFWLRAGLHVVVGAACLVAAAGVIYRSEHQLWVNVRMLRQSAHMS